MPFLNLFYNKKIFCDEIIVETKSIDKKRILTDF